jgi:phage tail sheath protein FI
MLRRTRPACSNARVEQERFGKTEHMSANDLFSPAAAETAYSAATIEVLEGLEPVRRRRGTAGRSERRPDPLGGRRWIPPTGHILGVYARTERQRGIWKAPAGNAARLNGALDVQQHITDTDHTDLVKNASVNAVRFISGQGIVIDSSRTLSTNTLWLYVNVRLLFNFVKTSLKSGLRWAVQERNTPELWNKIKYNSVTPFLMGLWRRGAFGPGAPEEVFTVKVDAENNPPERIQQGILTVEVYFYPSRPAETIILTIGQQEGGASAGEG